MDAQIDQPVDDTLLCEDESLSSSSEDDAPRTIIMSGGVDDTMTFLSYNELKEMDGFPIRIVIRPSSLGYETTWLGKIARTALLLPIGAAADADEKMHQEASLLVSYLLTNQCYKDGRRVESLFVTDDVFKDVMEAFLKHKKVQFDIPWDDAWLMFKQDFGRFVMVQEHVTVTGEVMTGTQGWDASIKMDEREITYTIDMPYYPVE